MKRLLGHIVLWCCCLWVALSLSGTVGVSAAEAAAKSRTETTTEQLSTQQTHHKAILHMIHASLCSDALPATPGVNGTRVITPVFRLAPKQSVQLAVPAVLQGHEFPSILLSHLRVQESLSSSFRASLDAAGYYVVALRKIII